MAISRGGRSLLVDAGSWVAALGVAACAVIYQTELRQAGYQLLGLMPPSAEAAPAPTGQRPIQGAQSSSGRQVELRAGRNGHFLAEAEINGRRIETMVDTGASVIALTYDDAQTIGLSPQPRDFTHQVNTANGVSKVAPVKLDRVMIGDILVRDVQAVITEPGKLNVTLLGNSFLSRVSYRMSSGRLLLED